MGKTQRVSNVSRVVTALAAALLLLLTALSPALANCDPPIASFPDFAPKAERIVIGDVVSVDPSGRITGDPERSSRFTLRVLYTVRGEPVSTLTVRDLPFARSAIDLMCTSCLIAVKRGDRVALAIGVRGGLDSPPNVIAWIGGTPPETACWDQTTVALVYELVGKTPPPPATSTAPAQRPAAPWPPLVGALLAVGAACLVARRRRRRGNSPP